jgi:hypothetical protein
MLDIRTTAPLVKFRATLPAWMEPKGQAFIEIDARPAGKVNTPYLAAREGVVLAHRVRGNPEAASEPTVESIKASREFGRDWIAMIYDTCVMEWRTNLIDNATGQTLTCDKATFLDLAEVRVEEIAKAMTDFQEQLLTAGEAVLADTEATIKN